MKQYRKKVFLVTGGVTGIGEAIALQAAKQDYFVCLNYLSNQTNANATLKKIKQLGGEAIAIQADISKQREVKRLFAELIEVTAPPCVLVNNAGISGLRQSFIEYTEKDLSNIIQTNLMGTLFCCQEALIHMVSQQSGSIVNISSFVALSGGFKMAPYAASKGAIETLTKSLAKEFGRQGIRINGIAPGIISTNQTATMETNRTKRALDSIPLGRFGTAEEVAEAVIWIASDKASYINGVSLPLTGGKN